MNTMSRFDRRKQLTRQGLMQAAADLILEKGFDAVSIQDIVDRADLGRATFYLHFRDKQEIAARIIQESFEAVEAQGAAALEGFSVEQSDYLSFVGYFMHIATQGSLFRAIGGTEGAAAVASYIGAYVLKRAEMRLAQHNLYPDVPPEVAAQFMTGALMQMTSWWLAHTDDYSAPQVAAMFFRLLHGKLPPEMGR